jgi:MFS family permease
LFSLLSGIGIAYLDKIAEKNSEKKIMIKDDEKFKWSDLYSLKLSFWILTGSCVLTYMSIFPYIQIASDLLQTKYHFSTIQAGYLFGVPYIISAIASPFLGLLIDKFGKRALLSCLSSFILIIGFSSSMMMPECDKCYNELYPLILTGIGYSIYASAIWGSVPYVVKANSVGTAFGIATAIQNIGLCIAPLIVGMIKDKTKLIDHGYFWVNAFFVLLNCAAFCLNLTQYYLDIYYNNSILDKVD